MTTVFTNATVFTGDEHAPLAEAVAVDGGRILAVGDGGAVAEVAGEGAEVVDLDSALVSPGFVEAHTHLAMFGQALDKVQLRDAATLTEIQDRLRRARRRIRRRRTSSARPGCSKRSPAGSRRRR